MAEVWTQSQCKFSQGIWISAVVTGDGDQVQSILGLEKRLQNGSAVFVGKNADDPGDWDLFFRVVGLVDLGLEHLS